MYRCTQYVYCILKYDPSTENIEAIQEDAFLNMLLVYSGI